jgi:hypothetical protein
MAKIERIFTSEGWVLQSRPDGPEDRREIYNFKQYQYTFTLGQEFEMDITLPEEVFILTRREERTTIAQKDPKTLRYRLRRGGEEKLVRSDELMRMLTYVAENPAQYLKDM